MNRNNNRLPPFYKVCIFIVALQPFLFASANVNPMAAIDAQEQSRHQERERAFQEQIFPKEDKDIITQIYKTEFNKAFAQTGLGTGGNIQRALQAVTAAVQGLAGGDMVKALAGASAPYLAGVIRDMTTDPLTDGVNLEANLMAHATLGALMAQVTGNSALAGASGAVMGEYIAQQLYADIKREDLSEEQKNTISALGTLAAGLAGGLTGDSLAGAMAGAQASKNAVEHNLLSTPSATKRDKLAEKIQQGDKTLQTNEDYLHLENADKRSDALVAQFKKDPTAMTEAERNELNSYVRHYAADMQTQHGDAVTRELITGLLTGPDYLKSAPNSEAQQKAQTIMNTWGYHNSNASMGDPILAYGLGPLGNSIKTGMATNTVIGVGANTAVQLSGNDPFSYVDAVMAGVTAASSTGKSLKQSAVINMGGAALGRAAKGEDPTNAVIGAGYGSIFGGIAGKVATEQLKPVIKDGSAALIGVVTGSTVSEITGNNIKDGLDDTGNINEEN